MKNRIFRHRKQNQRWLWHMEKQGLCIDGCCEEEETLVVPAEIGGMKVKNVRLGRDSLGICCRSLIIPEGVTEVSLDLRDAPILAELSFPTSARLVGSPLGIEDTDWFRSCSGGVYLGGCYCGTPGGGCGEYSELVVAEGTVAIAEGADFHCFWHSIVLPDSVKSVGKLAFGDAPCLEMLQLGSGLEYIGDFAFQSCPRLTKLYLPDALRSETAPFMMCSGLREVSMPADCPIKTKFSRCPRLVLRDGCSERVVRHAAIPAAIVGRLSAHPAYGPIVAAGREYPNFKCIALHSWRDDVYTDRYGRIVYRVDRGGLRESDSWYISWEEGITEIHFDEMAGVWLVHDGLWEDDLPEDVYIQLEKTRAALDIF